MFCLGNDDGQYHKRKHKSVIPKKNDTGYRDSRQGCQKAPLWRQGLDGNPCIRQMDR